VTATAAVSATAVEDTGFGRVNRDADFQYETAVHVPQTPVEPPTPKVERSAVEPAKQQPAGPIRMKHHASMAERRAAFAQEAAASDEALAAKQKIGTAARATTVNTFRTEERIREEMLDKKREQAAGATAERLDAFGAGTAAAEAKLPPRYITPMANNDFGPRPQSPTLFGMLGNLLFPAKKSSSSFTRLSTPAVDTSQQPALRRDVEAADDTRQARIVQQSHTAVQTTTAPPPVEKVQSKSETPTMKIEQKPVAQASSSGGTNMPTLERDQIFGLDFGLNALLLSGIFG
jgi:hypothetical protein